MLFEKLYTLSTGASIRRIRLPCESLSASRSLALREGGGKQNQATPATKDFTCERYSDFTRVLFSHSRHYQTTRFSLILSAARWYMNTFDEARGNLLFNENRTWPRAKRQLSKRWIPRDCCCAKFLTTKGEPSRANDHEPFYSQFSYLFPFFSFLSSSLAVSLFSWPTY